MKIGLFGKNFSADYAGPVGKLIDTLIRRGVSISVYEPFLSCLSQKVMLPDSIKTFKGYNDIKDLHFLLSIGGDGTLLDTAAIIRDTKIPVLGINTGRLGFLSNVDIQHIEECMEALINGHYTIDHRSLIEVGGSNFSEKDFPYALNDVTLLNSDRNSMIAIHTYVNDIFMCTYWADGLIVSTPTGSTAYSLSCGGPIVTPDSNNLILTPIAPHNLNVRPFVISNTNKVSLHPEARSGSFSLTLDSRTYSIGPTTQLELTRASFEMNLVNLEGQNFFNTIRNKLGWGLDKRN